jgi:16S rRNA G1207 methylase RsmC
MPMLLHLAAADAEERGAESSVDCAGRDSLALAISRHNLPLERPGATLHAASPAELPQLTSTVYDLIIAEVGRLPENPLPDELLTAAEQLLASGGRLFVLGRSSDINPFFRSTAAFRAGRSFKHQGYRSLILQKK